MHYDPKKRLFKEYRNKAFREMKPEACIFCGAKEMINSHTIPQMILNNSSKSGCFYRPVIGSDAHETFMEKTGVKNTMVFRLICGECDKRYFHYYEDPNFLNNVFREGECFLSDEALTSIMLKSALFQYSQRKWSEHFQCLSFNVSLINQMIPNVMGEKLDQEELTILINKLKAHLDGGNSPGFHLGYFCVLEHESKLSAQVLLSIDRTPNNKIINDKFNYDKNYKIAMTEFVVLPFKGKTLVMSYCLKEDYGRLKPYFDYLDTLTDGCKLKLVEATLLSFSEDIYTDEVTLDLLISNPKCKQIIDNAPTCQMGFLGNGDIDLCFNGSGKPILSGFRKCVLVI